MRAVKKIIIGIALFFSALLLVTLIINAIEEFVVARRFPTDEKLKGLLVDSIVNFFPPVPNIDQRLFSKVLEDHIVIVEKSKKRGKKSSWLIKAKIEGYTPGFTANPIHQCLFVAALWGLYDSQEFEVSRGADGKFSAQLLYTPPRKPKEK